MHSAKTNRHKVTLIGLGAMGRRHARVFAALADRFEVVGCYDVRPDAPLPAHVPRLGSEAEAITRGEVVIVATPMNAHAETAGRALAAGRHVLVEKPLCATAAQAATLVAQAARGEAHLFVGHSERFNPVVRALARLVRDDQLVAIDLQRVGPSRPADCGVLVNLGVHDLDLAAYLGGGDIALRGAVGGRTTTSPAASGGEDFAHVLFETARGASGHLYVDRSVATKRRAITLATTRWLYEGDLLTHRLLRTMRTGGAPSDVPLLLDEPLALQALAVADALDGRSQREIATGIDGAHAVALAERAAACCYVPEKLSLLAQP
ncbi:MAG: Gfo/Idh/MocA family oxidoreductase [Myxococcota bacterium]|nr:Gfo/Idh/MocA family oxidoreductase [Myxococcota bacterium]